MSWPRSGRSPSTWPPLASPPASSPSSTSSWRSPAGPRSGARKSSPAGPEGKSGPMNMSIATPARWATRADGSPPSPQYTAPRSVRAAGPLAAPAPVPATDRVPALVWVIAAVFVAAELAISNRYGLLQDELYFIQPGRPLAFDYVDQPPLAPPPPRLTA